MRLEMPACVVCMRSAAALKLPRRATHTKASRKRTFMAPV